MTKKKKAQSIKPHLFRYAYSRRAAAQSLRQAFLYFVIGCLWIFVSDKIMALIAVRYHNIMLVSTLKGILFVFVTAVIFFILMFRAIKKILKSNEEITKMAYRDHLTGLHNRQYIENNLPLIDTETNLPLSVIVGDFNGLKMANDAFGHALGNEMLKLSASTLCDIWRDNDVVSRWGSDEFLILLPRTSSTEAKEMVGRFKAACLQKEHCGINVDITFGMSTKNLKSEKFIDVIGLAETVMYDYKTVDSRSMRSKTISVIMNTLHEKNPREEAHSKRVGVLCGQLCESAGFPIIDIDKMNMIGFLHDIGKIAIGDDILNKSNSLTEDEYSMIRQHPEIGYRILYSYYGDSDITKAVLCHHERWDGKGYPRGLKGDSIPKIARIIAIADSFDAMTSDRPYRQKLALEAAEEEIRKNAGLQFDPELVRIFIEKVYHKT